MKWIKVPLEDETYEALKWLAEGNENGYSPEELCARLVSGTVYQVTQMIATGRLKELEELAKTPAAGEALAKMLRESLPEEDTGGLWLPR